MQIEPNNIFNDVISSVIFGLVGFGCGVVYNEYVVPWWKKKFSSKLRIDSVGGGAERYQGERFCVTVTNVSTRIITIRKVYFVWLIDEGNYNLPLVDYKELLEIQPGQTKVISGDLFTKIEPNIEFHRYIADVNVGFQEPSGNVIWVKLHGKCDSAKLNDLYRKNKFQLLSVIRNKYDGKVLSCGIKRVVRLRYLNYCDEIKDCTFFVYANGNVFDDIGNVRIMTKEEYDNEEKFLDWFKKHFRLYKDDIHVSFCD